MSTITLTRADDGRTVDLSPGDTLVLRLAENPTTGYQWALDAGSDDVLALRLPTTSVRRGRRSAAAASGCSP